MDADQGNSFEEMFEAMTEADAEVVAPEPAAEQPAPEPEPAPKAENTGEHAAPPAATESEKPETVPLAVLREERAKRQRLQAIVDEYEAAKEKKPADFFDDPQEALGAVERKAQQIALVERLKLSRFMAEQQFSKETVEEAYAFFDENPHLSTSLLNEPSPFHAAVEFYKRHKQLQEIGPDPDEWVKRREEALRASIRAELEAELAQKAPTKPAAPPRSLASVPAAGGEATPKHGSVFDELFG